MRTNQKGFSVVEGLLIFLVLGILSFTGWFVLNAQRNFNQTDADTSNASNREINSKSLPSDWRNISTEKIVIPDTIFLSAPEDIVENLTFVIPNELENKIALRKNINSESQTLFPITFARSKYLLDKDCSAEWIYVDKDVVTNKARSNYTGPGLRIYGYTGGEGSAYELNKEDQGNIADYYLQRKASDGNYFVYDDRRIYKVGKNFVTFYF